MASDATGAPEPISFQTSPERYRHWRLSLDGPVATLVLDVDESVAHPAGYTLKLNSYDLSVDIELHDAVARLRFEHPEVRTVVLTSGKDRVFCAGANIGMLAAASHGHKVNFCKFTNETRLAIEDASAGSGQRYLAALNGTASGGGYELALACEHLLLVDDGSSAVSLPEVPLLGVLPGTGGLTRLVDKRLVRRDHADVFATKAEGLRGDTARAWRLVDEVAPRSRFAEAVASRADALAATSDRPVVATAGDGVPLVPLDPVVDRDLIDYGPVVARLDRPGRLVDITVNGPGTPPPAHPGALAEQLRSGADGGADWPLRVWRALDDLLLRLRFNEPGLGTLVLRTAGDPDAVLAWDAFLAGHGGDWLVRELTLLAKRTLKRLDLTGRSLFAVIDEGSCFAGSLAELALAADRTYHLDTSECRRHRGGDDTDGSTRGTCSGGGAATSNPRAPSLVLSDLNFGPLPMGNGLTRLQSRFLADPAAVERLAKRIGEPLEALEALDLGLVTFAPDDLDWDDELRVALEERASLSPDALTGLEANCRFAGPETMETKIFARLSAWQNWIFLRPNASGPEGALARYGTGTRPAFDLDRT